MSDQKKAAVVGAGLAGLACAVELQKQGWDVEVYEKSSTAGGRAQTESVDGFLLDRGFQVYLPAYEMGQYYFDHEKLGLKGFTAGAQIFYKGDFHTLSDPLRDPASFVSTLSNQLGSLKDKILILSLKIRAARADKSNQDDQSAGDFLRAFGFSEKFITTFFKPFFSGIFLEKDLTTSKSFFIYLFDKFASCEASLPTGGLGALSKQLAEKLGKSKIRFGAEVVKVSSSSLELKSGEVKAYDRVVLAVTPEAVNKFVSTDYSTHFNATQVSYYKTKSKTFANKKLILNANEDAVVNSLACLSAVNDSYAPSGWNLFSVSTVGQGEHTAETIEQDLQKILGADELTTWQHVKTIKVPYALPSKPLYSSAVLKKDDVFICGDFTRSPSIQGALSSGYQVAQEISSI